MKLKPGWQHVTLAEVAENSTKATKDPYGDGFERYIVGKDIPADGGRIATWSPVGDGLFGSRIRTIVEEGDVICTTRGPNLRVARSTFRCLGAHTNFVLRSRSEEIILQDYLALVIESEGFQGHLARNFRGSVNLFVNWSDAARYEFALPPIEEQQRIAEVLSNAAEVSERYDDAAAALELLLGTFVTSSFETWVAKWDPVPVSAMGELRLGRQKAPKYEAGEHPVSYLRVANVGHLGLMLEDLEIMEFAPAEQTRYGLVAGDVVITEGDIVSPFNVGRSAVFRGANKTICFQNTLIRLRPNQSLEPDFVMGLLEGARLTGVLAAGANTTTVTHLGLKRFSAINLPLPDQHDRARFVDQFRRLLAVRDALVSSRDAGRSLTRQLRGALVQ